MVRAIPLAAVLAVLALAPPRAAAGEPAAAGATLTAEIARLVPLLRSSDQAERERGAARLVEIGVPALPALEAELQRVEAPAVRVRALIAVIEPRARAPGKPPPAAAPGERWYETKFREAARRVDQGDHLGALKVLDAIMVLEPDCPIRDRIQALRIRAKELQVRASVVEARLVPKKTLLAPGEPLELGLEVKNVSGGPLVLALPDAAEGDIFGALEVETFEATPGGQRARTRELQRITAVVQGRLAAEESWKTSLAVRGQRPLPREAFRRVTISGSIRSRVLQRGDERIDRFLPLFPVEVFVVDAAWQPLARDPDASLVAAITGLRTAKDDGEAAGLSRKLFFAAMLAPAADRETAIARLGATLEKEGDRAAAAAMAVLSVLAERPLDPDARVWREWLKRRGD